MRKEREQKAEKDLPVWPEPVMGGKYVRLLEKYMQQLRGEDDHGNRRLFLDDVFVAYLLAFFNPTVRSLRTVEDFSQTRQVQKYVEIDRICKSTLSDFNRLAEPQRLETLILALRNELSCKSGGRPLPKDDLQALLQHTIAVDGTFLPALADVTWAIANTNNHGAIRHRARLDVHLNVSTWLPEAIVVPETGQSEADSASAHVRPGCLYIYDRGYMSFALIRAHYGTEPPEQPSSHFVVRFKREGSNSPKLQDAVDRELTDEDRTAGIVSDRVGYFTSESAHCAGISKIKVREVVLLYEDKGETKTLRLITNLCDVSASTIVTLYQFRWQVELFFRWFKSFANFGHLLSSSRDGVLTHLYVTIIGVLLMYLHTGYRPSKYMFALMSQVALGAATLEEILPILRERERRCELDRQSRARRRAKKKS